MPRRNTIKRLLGGSLYHVYNREATAAPMFLDREDRRFFRELFRRHLAKEVVKDSRGRAYRNLRSRVRVAAFAICRTHFHLVVFQIEPGGLETLMRSVMNAYVPYFKNKYSRSEPMCVAQYRARLLLTKREKLNAIAYVNENHGDNCFCEFCSHGAYATSGASAPDWLDVRSGLDLFGGVAVYLEWMAARRSMRRIAGES